MSVKNQTCIKCGEKYHWCITCTNISEFDGCLDSGYCSIECAKEDKFDINLYWTYDEN